MEEARRRSPNLPGKGLFIPMVTRANVDSATSTTGGPFKFTQPGDFIEMLRNRSSVMRAGSTVLPGLTGPVTFPKQSGAVTGSWVAENPGSDLSRSAMVTGTVTLAFKTVQAASAVSRQALFSAASGNYDLENIIRQDLATVIALTIDLGALNGPGTANQPTGVLQNTSIGSVTLGAAGGTMAWANWVALETAIADANADTSRMAYITNTKQRGTAKNKAVLDATASGVPIWGGSLFASGLQETPTTVQDGVVNGYRAIASNQVPRNLTKGTSTTICSAVLFGAFEHLIVGQFGAGFEVLVDPYTLKLQGMIDLTAWNFVDVALRYPEAFAAVKDAL
jgi:HK97 family phage major capsid protein